MQQNYHNRGKEAGGDFRNEGVGKDTHANTGGALFVTDAPKSHEYVTHGWPTEPQTYSVLNNSHTSAVQAVVTSNGLYKNNREKIWARL